MAGHFTNAAAVFQRTGNIENRDNSSGSGADPGVVIVPVYRRLCGRIDDGVVLDPAVEVVDDEMLVVPAGVVGELLQAETANPNHTSQTRRAIGFLIPPAASQ